MKNFDYPEGATPLNHNDLEGLKPKHITERQELDRLEQENIGDAISWLLKRRKGEILSEQFVLKLHEKMFDKVWTWAGKYRRLDTNIGINWTNIPVNLRHLLDDVKYWIENSTYSHDEIAIRFHHRLVAIHLFPNGNGRHARLITEMLQAELLGEKPFSWGEENLTKGGDVRDRYIQALRDADNNDYNALLEFARS